MRSRWLRRLRAALLWVLALLAVYSMVGFFLAPYLLRTYLPPMLAEKLGGHWQVEGVAFNPFRLELALSGFSLKTAEGEELAGIGGLSANLDGWVSLRRRALVASLGLAAPSVNIHIDHGGKPNYAFLLPAAGKPQAKASKASFPVLLSEFKIQQGRLVFEDHSRGEPFKMAWMPLDFSVENLGTLPGESARFKFDAHGEAKETLAAQGDFKLGPIDGEGEIQLRQLALAPLALWLGGQQPYRMAEGTLDLKLKYKLRESGKTTDFEISDAEAELGRFRLEAGGKPYLQAASLAAKGIAFHSARQQLAIKSFAAGKLELQAETPVQEENGQARRMKIDTVSLGDIGLNLKERAAKVGAFKSTDAVLAAWLKADGGIGLAGLLPAAPAAGQPSATTVQAQSAPWRLQVDAIEIGNYDLALRDFSMDPPTAMRLAPLHVTVKNLDTGSESAPINLNLDSGFGQKGQLTIDGEITLQPLTAALRLSLDQLRLQPFQPYLDKATRINIVKGMLSLSGDLKFEQTPNNALRFSGDMGVSDFDSEDKSEEEDFIGWKDLRLNGVVFETAPLRLSIRETVATEPYARVQIAADGKFNIAENLSPPVEGRAGAPAKPEKPDKQEKPAAPLSVVIGTVHIANGRSDFADLSLKPSTFSTQIRELNGDIRDLSSREDAKADVLLEGKIEDSSPVKISGKINPFKVKAFTDIAMHFRDVNLTTLSPYSSKFAGYRIEEGKLTMDLAYYLADGQLTAKNNFVLDHLTLGERVASPDATSLPVRLAVALLKDANGRIDINLPISGDLSNPQVSVRGLLAEAATEMLTKLVTSPFTILSNLMASGSEQLDAVKFNPGVAKLDAAEKDKLAKVAKALKERPALVLEIKGVANPRMDSPALAERDLLRQLKNAKLIDLATASGKISETETVGLSEEDYSRLFTQIYRNKNPNFPELKELKAGAYLTGDLLRSARQRLLQSWQISELDLRDLARTRAQGIRDYLVNEAGLPDQRIYLLDVKLSEPGDKEIKARLSLNSS